MNDEKFLEILTNTDEWLVETDEGFKEIVSIGKTIEYKVFTMVLENGFYIECADDHIVFTNNGEKYVKDLTNDDEVFTKEGLSKVREVIEEDYSENMYDLQVNSDKKAYYTNGILSHNSTICGIYALWFAMFATEPKNIFILANKGKTSQSLLDDIKQTYENIDPYLKRPIIEYNKTSIEFDNRSKIQTGTTTPDSIRGESVSLLILDEFAMVPNHIVEEFYKSSLPTITEGGRIIITSTPKGTSNLFYEIFTNAKSGLNGYAYFDMDWRDVPGRDEDFKKKMLKTVSLADWNQEYEAKFLGSSRTLIHGDTLATIKNTLEEPVFFDDEFKCWEKPKDKHLYLVSVDVAKGTERDYSVAQILDITNPELAKQVAIYFSNKISPYYFSERILHLAKNYKDAWIIVENNTYGHDVCRRLYEEFEYTNIYKEDKKDFGIGASHKSKSLATSSLKRLVEEKKILIKDLATYEELCGFIEVNPDIFRAETGKYNFDDKVMALVWAAYFLGSKYWNDYKEYLINEAKGIATEDTFDPSFMVDEYDRMNNEENNFDF